MADFIQFPKMLYKGNDNKTVKDHEEEDAARAEGWHDYGDAPAPAAPAEDPKA